MPHPALRGLRATRVRGSTMLPRHITQHSHCDVTPHSTIQHHTATSHHTAPHETSQPHFQEVFAAADTNKVMKNEGVVHGAGVLQGWCMLQGWCKLPLLILLLMLLLMLPCADLHLAGPPCTMFDAWPPHGLCGTLAIATPQAVSHSEPPTDCVRCLTYALHRMLASPSLSFLLGSRVTTPGPGVLWMCLKSTSWPDHRCSSTVALDP